MRSSVRNTVAALLLHIISDPLCLPRTQAEEPQTPSQTQPDEGQAQNLLPQQPAGVGPLIPTHNDSFVVLKLPSLETPEATKAALRAWAEDNYSGRRDFGKNREGFFTTILNHLNDSSTLQRYDRKLDELFTIERATLDITLIEDPNETFDDACVRTKGLPKPLVNLPNNPNQRYIGQNNWAKDHARNKKHPADEYPWGRAMPRPLIGLHEFEHVPQNFPEQGQLQAVGMRIPSDSDVWEPHPNRYFTEPPAVLAEYVCAAAAAREARGAPVESGVCLAPGYKPSIDWLREQAEQHGYKPLGGDKNMTELFNTPAGQAWLRMQLQRYADEQVKEKNEKAVE